MGVLMRLPAVCVEKVLIVVVSGHSAEPTGDNFLSFFNFEENRTKIVTVKMP